MPDIFEILPEHIFRSQKEGVSGQKKDARSRYLKTKNI